jgi:DNA relaxase NicK
MLLIYAVEAMELMRKNETMKRRDKKERMKIKLAVPGRMKKKRSKIYDSVVFRNNDDDTISIGQRRMCVLYFVYGFMLV